ncbi:ash family protein [Aeromonas caviae]|uniref:Ash family protein n=1 Tax=Aeromonas caviae TaxID=648 RepID=A0ABU5WAK7_AERCA|nr:ash family protein [Aeromonas caviae]MEA9437002.1 ash family protein [Aeromonas caviae]
MDSIHRTASTFRRLPNFAIGLYEDVRNGTILPATAKSVAGRRNPSLHIAPTHALAWFFVGARSPLLGELLAYPVGGPCCVMVARAGQPRGWPVSMCAGIPTPARATTMGVGTLVGSENLSHIEAAIMATIPTPVISKRFTFLIASSACRLADMRRIRTITAVADTEAQAQARIALAGLPLVFLSRTPSGRAAA